MARKATHKRRPRPRTPGTHNSCEFPCISFEQGKFMLAMFNCSGKALWDIVKINRKEEDKEEGYQRTLSPARADKIATFIDKGNPIPASLLVSFDKGVLRNNGTKLVVPRKVDSGWVIDGQHRLEGAYRSENDITFPIMAFVGLSEAEQINQFVTINREHKGVPSSLYYDLLKHLPGGKNEAELIKERSADLATMVKNDEESPFHQRIVVTTAPKKGELSLTNWVRKIAPLLKHGQGRLAVFSDEAKIGVLNNYYLGLAQVFSDEYRKADSIFFKTLGFGALINTLPTFIDLTLQHQSGFRVVDVIRMFKRIADFDFAAWHQAGSGNQAESLAGDDLRQRLLDSLGESDTAGIRLK